MSSSVVVVLISVRLLVVEVILWDWAGVSGV